MFHNVILACTRMLSLEGHECLLKKLKIYNIMLNP